jgi:hypothetical protein
MAGSGRPVWSTARKVVANIVPLAALVPLAATLAVLWPTEGPGLRVVALCAAFPVVGWLAVGLLGMVGNGAVRREMERRLDRALPGCRDSRMFVGFAGPGHRSALDPHEEVGWLLVREDALELVGDRTRTLVPRCRVRAVRRAPNSHTWLGLGGWVAIEWEAEGSPALALVEPRESPTHFGNRPLGRDLASQLDEWSRTGRVPDCLARPPGGTLDP